VSYRRDVDDVRQSALNALDELVEIYRSTDPALGAASEKSKHSKALAALRLAGNVTSELIGWAQSHVMGAIYREDHGKNKSKFKEDSHANELQPFGDDIELTANQWRLFIGRIIREMAPSSGDWRQALALALFALNDGEVLFLTKPASTGKHGRPFTLRQLRFIAILHVHVLVGTGLKKYSAESKVANVLNHSVETLRTWEKGLLNGRADLRRKIALAQKLAQFHLHNFDNPLRDQIEIDDREDGAIVHEGSQAFALHVQLRNHPLHVLAVELRNAKMRP
jgi:hypothetical protein